MKIIRRADIEALGTPPKHRKIPTSVILSHHGEKRGTKDVRLRILKFASFAMLRLVKIARTETVAAESKPSIGAPDQHYHKERKYSLIGVVLSVSAGAQ